MKYGTGNIAKRLGIHVNTVRAWADEYGEFMSPAAKKRYKKYDRDDVVVLSTIAQYRQQGIDPETVKKLLRQGHRVDNIPAVPDTTIEEARQQIELVPKTSLENAQNQITVLEQQIGRLIEERNEIANTSADRIASLNTRIGELERQLGESRGRLTTIESEHERMSKLVLYLGLTISGIAVAVVIALVVFMIVTR